MTETYAPAGLGRPLLVFLAVLVAGQLLLVGLDLAMPDFTLPQSFNLIVTIAAAILAGRSFARASGRLMTGGEKLRFGFWATVISLLLAAVALYAVFRYYDVPMTGEMLMLVAAGGDPDFQAFLGRWIWLLLAGAVVFTFAICAGGAGSGAKSWVRRQEKLAGRQH